MSNKLVPGLELPPLAQVGFVVRDLASAMSYYHPLFGEFPVRMEHEFENMIFRGKPVAGKLAIAIAKSGEVEIELIEVVRGYTLHSEFLEQRGEGMHHLGFIIDDMDEMLARAERASFKPVCGERIPGVADYEYLESEHHPGLVLEFLDYKDPSQKPGA